MITKEQILQATNGGWDIIMNFYPQAVQGKGFKIRNESDASAHLKRFGDVWKVTDFGDDGYAMNAIDICMKEMGISFEKAIAYLASQYGIRDETIRESNRPEINKYPAVEGEEEGDFLYEEKDFSDYELKVLGPHVTKEICQAYNYVSLKFYSRTKKEEDGRLMTTVIRSTETFPIFMRKCPGFEKIYTPLSYNKQYRFFYHGDKPKQFINGLDELKARYEQSNSGKEEDKKEKKLPRAYICAGERDALCCAAYGGLPLWFNSETYFLSDSEYHNIQKYVDEVCIIPDLDETGRRKTLELAKRFIDLKIVWLPQWLNHYKDHRGNPRKDLRDFAELCPRTYDFNELVKSAMPIQFWESVLTDKGNKLEINTEHYLHFLACNDIFLLDDPRGKMIVKNTNNVLEVYDSSKVRIFTKDFLNEKNVSISIKNLFNNSRKINSSIFELLSTRELDFRKTRIDGQEFFFLNTIVDVSAEQIQTKKLGNSHIYIWKDDIIQHEFRKLDQYFEIAEMEDGFEIEVLSKKSNFFKYLIQTSRVFWRNELEYRTCSLTPEEKEKYLQENRFEIKGSLLTDEEKSIQMQHLVNKIFVIGYMLHRYKFIDKAWCVYCMDARISEIGDSNGRTGKSFFIKAISHLLNTVTIGGRLFNPQTNQFAFERVNEYSDLVFIDDASAQLNFDNFFDAITGEWQVEPKNKAAYSIPFEKSPKLAITTNYAPNKTDDSSYERMLFALFSDYYHGNGEDSDYLEKRDIFSDFRKRLMDENYSEEEWNEDFNFMLQCLQFYLSCAKDGIKINPPMENIKTRTYMNIMGDTFHAWACVYFSIESGNLNRFISKREAMDNFIYTNNTGKWTTQKFTKALKAFCKNYGYELNPKQYLNNNGRMIRKFDGRVEEGIFIKT